MKTHDQPACRPLRFVTMAVFLLILTIPVRAQFITNLSDSRIIAISGKAERSLDSVVYASSATSSVPFAVFSTNLTGSAMLPFMGGSANSSAAQDSFVGGSVVLCYSTNKANSYPSISGGGPDFSSQTGTTNKYNFTVAQTAHFTLTVTHQLQFRGEQFSIPYVFPVVWNLALSSSNSGALAGLSISNIAVSTLGHGKVMGTNVFTGILQGGDICSLAFEQACSTYVYTDREDGEMISSLSLVLEAAEYPTLQITQTNTQAAISWVTPEIGLVLQSATNLDAPAAWTNTGSPPVVQGMTNVVHVPMSSEPWRFFRLNRP